MNLKELQDKIKSDLKSVSFQEVIEVIDSYYIFTTTAFKNGNVFNKIGENSGSCKIFAFAQLNDLSKDETLNLFGNYYRLDVLSNTLGLDHLNIRNFMKYGWERVEFTSEALEKKTMII